MTFFRSTQAGKSIVARLVLALSFSYPANAEPIDLSHSDRQPNLIRVRNDFRLNHFVNRPLSTEGGIELWGSRHRVSVIMIPQRKVCLGPTIGTWAFEPSDFDIDVLGYGVRMRDELYCSDVDGVSINIDSSNFKKPLTISLCRESLWVFNLKRTQQRNQTWHD